MGAYGSGNISCAQGIFERFYTTLEATLQLAVHDKESYGYKPEYKELLFLFGTNKPDMAKILSNFDGEDKDEEFNSYSPEKKVRKLIDYIKSEYGKAEHSLSAVEDDLNEFLKTMNSNIEELFTNKDYPNSIFGGKKRRSQTRKKLRHRNKAKKSKRKTRKYMK